MHAAGDSVAKSQETPAGEATKDTASEGAAAAKNAASKGATAAKDAASEGAKLASKAGRYSIESSATQVTFHSFQRRLHGCMLEGESL